MNDFPISSLTKNISVIEKLSLIELFDFFLIRYYCLYRSIQLYLLRLRDIKCNYIICQLSFLLITIIPRCSLGKNMKIYAEKIHTALVAIYELECSICAGHI